MEHALLSIELPAGKEAPKELRLFKMGENDSTQGTFLFTERSGKSVLAHAKEWGNRFHLDWDHRSARAIKGENVDASAAAWFDLDLRPDGLYAVQLSWTKKGKEDVEGDYYKYISPWFDYDADTREVVSLTNAALTNLPSLKRIEALASIQPGPRSGAPKEEPTMERKAMLSALGLAETATDSELASKLAELKAFKTQVLSSTGATNDFEAMSALLNLKGSKDQVERLTKQIEQDKVAAVAKEREALLSQAISEGRLEPGSELKKHLDGQPVEAVKTVLASLTATKKSPAEPPKGDKQNAPTGTIASATLSQEQTAPLPRMAALFGNKPEDVEKHWKELIAEQQNG